MSLSPFSSVLFPNPVLPTRRTSKILGILPCHFESTYGCFDTVMNHCFFYMEAGARRLVNFNPLDAEPFCSPVSLTQAGCICRGHKRFWLIDWLIDWLLCERWIISCHCRQNGGGWTSWMTTDGFFMGHKIPMTVAFLYLSYEPVNSQPMKNWLFLSAVNFKCSRFPIMLWKSSVVDNSRVFHGPLGTNVRGVTHDGESFSSTGGVN